MRAAQVRILSASLLLDIGGFVAIALVGAFAVQITGELHISTTDIGIAATVFFLFGGLAAIVTGPEIDRFGWYRGATAGSVLSVAALLSMALIVHSSWGLMAAMAVAGIASALNIPSTNVMLFRSMPMNHLGLAISIKQSSIPLALMVAGLALPSVALNVGWRWAFAGAAAFPIIGLAITPRRVASAGTTEPQRRSASRAAMRRLWRVGLSVYLAALLPGALTAYCVVSLVDAGIANGMAGIVFAVASVAGILGRLAAGWRGDRSSATGWRDLAILMVGGGTGATLMASWQPAVMVGGCLLAFGMGWAWPSLTYLLVVKVEAQNPGSSSSVVQFSGMLGSASGPAIIGLAIPAVGLQYSWVIVGGLTILGGLLVLWAGRNRKQTVSTDSSLPTTAERSTSD